jgi:hypothetical protein
MRPFSGAMRVLINCRRGKSRSTAVRLVLLRHHSGPATETEWFTEGFDIADLNAAKALLDELET